MRTGLRHPKQASYDDAIAAEQIKSDHKMTVVLTRGDKFMRPLCMSCSPSCASVCSVGALQKTTLGPVTYDASKYMICRYCMVACPFSVPKYEWSKLVPNFRSALCVPTECPGKADRQRGDLSHWRHQVRRPGRIDRRSAKANSRQPGQLSEPHLTGSRKSAARRCWEKGKRHAQRHVTRW